MLQSVQQQHTHTEAITTCCNAKEQHNTQAHKGAELRPAAALLFAGCKTAAWLFHKEQLHSSAHTSTHSNCAATHDDV